MATWVASALGIWQNTLTLHDMVDEVLARCLFQVHVWAVVCGAHRVGSASNCLAVLFSERSRSAHPASTGAKSVAFADASSSLPARHARTVARLLVFSGQSSIEVTNRQRASWPQNVLSWRPRKHMCRGLAVRKRSRHHVGLERNI